MKNKYLLYIGIFLCMGIWACSNDAVYYDVNQKRSIYFTWDRYNSVTKTASDTVFFSFALYNETEYRVSSSDQGGRNAAWRGIDLRGGSCRGFFNG